MNFVERDYQTKAHDRIFEELQPHWSTLLVMATGLGKTIVVAHAIKTVQPNRVLFLAHRDELILQAKDKIHAVTGLPVEIEKADLYASTSLFHRMPVVVSSIQTQISGPPERRRYMRFKPEEFGLVIADEAHHSVSKSWMEVLAYYHRNPQCKLLGVTATADRADNKSMGQLFQSKAFQYDIYDAIQDGWLVDITQQYVPIESLDFSQVRETNLGDLHEGELSKVMEIEENCHGVCQPTLEVMFGLAPKTLTAIPQSDWRSYLGGLGVHPRRTIIFTVSVDQARLCCEILRRAVDGIEYVSGKTKLDERRSILGQFSQGVTHAVVNCNVLLEGFDNPGVEVIVMARPTLSRTLYTQSIGRATRPLPGVVDGIPTAEERRAAIANSPKPFCRILDFVGNSGRHKLISCVDVLGGKMSEAVREVAKAKAIESGKPKKILVTLSDAEVELARKKQEEQENRRRIEALKKAHLIAKVNYKLQTVSPFYKGDTVTYKPTISRDGRMFSEKQVRILREAGVDPFKVGYRQGQAIISKQLSTPSSRMIRALYKMGYLDAHTWTRQKAHKYLDMLAKLKWKRPPQGDLPL